MKTGLVKSRPSRLINNSTFKFKPNEWENGCGKKYVRALLNQHLLWIQLSHVPIKAVGIIGASKPSGAGGTEGASAFPFPPKFSVDVPFFPQACNFIKKETLAQVFSYEFCKFSKNTLPYRTPPPVASIFKPSLCNFFETIVIKSSK